MMLVLTPTATTLFSTSTGVTRPPGGRKPGADLCLPVFCCHPVFSSYPVFLPHPKKAYPKIALDFIRLLRLQLLRSTRLVCLTVKVLFSPHAPLFRPFLLLIRSGCLPKTAYRKIVLVLIRLLRLQLLRSTKLVCQMVKVLVFPHPPLFQPFFHRLAGVVS